ncbi:MAG: glycoside hydrolase family 3 C-terminal domain-containing protein [Terrisporobacter sp.]|uniref:glycoside hydrolase family 3 C-terminal domain-containing protein n=1 Tax=Terrisporobacter sp. TaxID=1965305 RepID=UPI002FCB3C6F
MNLHYKAVEITSKLTLEEKCKLCVGKNFWQLYGIDSLEIPSIWISDGPHGLRKEVVLGEDIFNSKSEKSVCFPTATAIASTFDENLAFKMGKSIGEECRSKDVAVILGPGCNIKRLPICGRNFEYFSEDPYVSGKIAAAYVKGVQTQGVGTSIKHFIANNQERYRMIVNSIIDERALREIYLSGMEIAIKEGKPWTVMSAYNRVNGDYCSENNVLINEILRNEWGYRGLVMSDWGGVNNFRKSHKSGVDLEMPGYDDDYYKEIKGSVESGELSQEIIDKAVIRIIELVLKYKKGKEIPYTFDLQEQINLAQKICEESSVLLKNEDNILPGNRKQNIAVIGIYARIPRIQGLGSSEVNPIEIDNAYDAFIENGCDVSYAPGYSLNENKYDEKLLQEAINIVKNKDIVYVFVGIPKEQEWEGLDRKNMILPINQENLIKEISKVNKNLVVIIQGGAPIEMQWSDLCKGILLTHLGGSRSGHGTVNLLLGYKNPCGKLCETYPISLNDCPSMKWYQNKNEKYKESIFVGYRYYDTAKIKVKYPFGYGLSYTTFEYSNLIMKHNEDDTVNVKITISNRGKRQGKEIIQVYVSCLNSLLYRANKELKYFKKVDLEQGQSKTIKFNLNRDAFKYYNVETHNWQVEGGYYKVQIASSCEDIQLSKLIYITGDKVKTPDFKHKSPSYYSIDKKEFNVGEEEFISIYGGKLPLIKDNIRPFTINSTIKDVESTFGGKLIASIIRKKAEETIGNDEMLSMMVNENIDDLPFRTFMMITRGKMSRKFVYGFVDFLNGRYVKGIKDMMKELKNLKE